MRRWGYVLASLEYRVPLSPRTVLDVGSTSKQFTAMAMLIWRRKERTRTMTRSGRSFPSCRPAPTGSPGAVPSARPGHLTVVPDIRAVASIPSRFSSVA